MPEATGSPDGIAAPLSLTTVFTLGFRMRVAVVYHIIPHYRLGVIQALDKSGSYSYRFFGSTAPLEGIKPVAPGAVGDFVPAPFAVWKRLYWQPASINVSLASDIDAVIYLANPNFISTWIGAVIARARGIRVLFWTHGWLRPESSSKSFIRNIFYRLAHKVLVYGERAKVLGRASGFPSDKITVIYNSLDEAAATPIYSALERGEAGADPRALFPNPDRPLLICTARLTRLCRFDQLFDAAALLSSRGTPCNILLVGDGPERAALEAHTRRLGLDVHFYGACYDEAILGALIYGADVTVSPGKVGLTAMHSLMYGTPVITHSDLDAQMPEVEAVAEGETGAFFARDDVNDLASTIENWLTCHSDRQAVRIACRRVITETWNPTTQMRLIEKAIAEVKV
jgi:glycosyltransferase involved in cell wall biosynthesis